MSFPSPSLDDRSFQDLVSEAKRLIPRHTPEWTNHNVADPGVALLELFAWMTESTIYRLNQVPDRWFVKFLELVGIRPYPAVSARTALTFWLSAAQPEPVPVPKGTQVGTLQTDERPSVVFTTEHEVVIRQPELVACVTEEAGRGEYVDRFADLEYERTRVRCFPGLQLDDAIYFGFRESCAANVLFLEIEATAIGIGIDPRKPPLVWEAWTGDEWEQAEIEPAAHRPGGLSRDDPGGDRTGGLNRDGSILMFMPFQHAADTLGGIRAHWLRARLIEGDPTYEVSPEIRALRVQSLGGQARARHSLAAPAEVLGRSDGEPGQVFRVEHTPVLPRSADETVRVITPEGATTWTEVTHFGTSGPDDLNYVWDSTTGEIRFGPEVKDPARGGRARRHGAVPPRDAEITVSGYRYGGGEIGNVGAGTLAVMRSTIPFIERAENRKRATGGVDPETVDNAKVRGPLTLATGGRAVTASDFERLTIEAARSVARAKCPRVEDPRRPIRVLVVPRVDVDPQELTLDDLRLDDELVDDISDYLGERKLLGRRVVIGEPEYVGVSVVARVVAEPGSAGDAGDDVTPSQLKALQQRCLDSLYRFIDPLQGGPDGSGWPFGWDLHAGGLYQRLASIPGIEEIEDVLIFKADPATRERQGRALDRYELPELSLFMSVQHYVLVLPEEVRRPS